MARVASDKTVLLVLAGLSALGYAWLAQQRAWSTAADVGRCLGTLFVLCALYGGGLLICARRQWRGQRLARFVLLSGLLFRILLWPVGSSGWSAVGSDLVATNTPPAYDTYLLYDHDVWRYLWDGQMVRSGLDPYRWAPRTIEDAADDGDPRFAWVLDEPWATIQTRIGYPTYRTVYPPLAQVAFASSTALAPGRVAMWKLVLLLAEASTCWLLAATCRASLGRPALVAIYAWNPLAIKEIAGSAHVDGLVVLALVAMLWLWHRGKDGLALAAFAGSILIKLTPLLIAPLVLRHTDRRAWWVLPSVGVVAAWPWVESLPMAVDSLRAFSRDWAFNAGPWAVLLHLSHRLGFEGRVVADLVALTATLGVVVGVTWRLRRRQTSDLATGAAVILGAYVLLSPTVMPWYLLWALPLAVFSATGRWLWPVVTSASLLSYTTYIDGVDSLLWRGLEFTLIGAAAAVAAWLSYRARARP